MLRFTHLGYLSAFKEAVYFRQESTCGSLYTRKHVPSVNTEAVPLEDVSQLIKCPFLTIQTNTADHKKKKKISHLFYILPTINLIPKSDFRESKIRGKTLDPFHL